MVRRIGRRWTLVAALAPLALAAAACTGNETSGLVTDDLPSQAVQSTGPAAVEAVPVPVVDSAAAVPDTASSTAVQGAAPAAIQAAPLSPVESGAPAAAEAAPMPAAESTTPAAAEAAPMPAAQTPPPAAVESAAVDSGPLPAIDSPASTAAESAPAQAPDTRAPTVRVVSPEDRQMARGTVILRVRTSDDLALARVEYAVGDRGFLPLSPSGEGGLYAATIDTTALPGGSHAIAVRAVDAAGNIGEARTTLVADNQAPSGRIVRPANGDLVTGTVLLQVSVQDDQDLAAVEYAVDDGPPQALTPSGEPGAYQAAIETGALRSGSHAITVRARDRAGNQATAVARVVVDRLPPTVSIQGPPNQDVVRGVVTLRVRAADNLAVSAVEYALGSAGFRPLRSNGAGGLWEAAIDTTALSGGSQVITVRAVDSAGNVGVERTTLVVDNQAPTLSLVRPGNDALVSGTISLQIRALDDRALAAVEFAVDDQGFRPLGPKGEPGGFEAAIDTTALKDGSHAFTVRALDKVGNATQAQLKVTVDNQAPVVSFLSPSNGQEATGTLVLQVRIADAAGLTSVEVAIDREGFRPLTLSSATGVYEAAIDTTAISDGFRSITVRARDRAGNAGLATTRVNVFNPVPEPPPEPPRPAPPSAPRITPV